MLVQLFYKLERQFNISSGTLHSYLQKDILALFEGIRVDEETLVARRLAFVTLTYEDIPYIFSGNEAEIIARNFADKLSYQETGLKGQTANGKSVLRGTVKVIPVDYSDFKRLNQEMERMNVGDILVAETTAPELMIACRKAAVIITDLGGLLSHAAIVSRELNIPCIVNTKHATKLFKDGDIVEVDANTGIIRKLI